MWRILKGLFTGDFHIHTWVIDESGMVDVSGGGSYLRIISRCSNCGNIKVKNTGKWW